MTHIYGNDQHITDILAVDTLVIARIETYDITIFGRITGRHPNGVYTMVTVDPLRMRQGNGSVNNIYIQYNAARGDIKPLPAEQQTLNPELLLDLYRADLTPTVVGLHG